ncbi:MAG: hypothetical protein GX445_01005 [Elusimicrobia bacterium]|nr:hypothetical protein [Elusimicrobiota bacterium]
MKYLFLVFLFNINSFSYTSPTSYSDAMNEIGLTAIESSLVQKDMKQKVNEQAANYEVLNRLNQAKIKVEEMIQRDNIAKAAKVVDLGFTAAGVVTGGAAVAAKEGGKQALKWYLAKKVSIEVGKEAVGVPGYSDAVKVGMYIYNKADERDIKVDFSKDSMESLTKAKQLVEVDDGRTLQEKLPELRQMIFDMEDKIEKTDFYLKACVKKLEELKDRAEKLEIDAKKRKEEENKRDEEAKKRIKDIEVKPAINTTVSKSVDVPVTIDPKDSEYERRLKIQSAIDSYVSSLKKKYDQINSKINEKYDSFEGVNVKRNLRMDSKDEVNDRIDAANYLKSSMASAETYSNAQDIERSAQENLKSLRNDRLAMEGLKNNIKSSIEPMIKEMADVAAEWRGVYDKYTPLGFTVSKYPDIEGSYSWNYCYIKPLSYIETFITGTASLEGDLSSIESSARTLKNRLYSNAYDFALKYAAIVDDLKVYIEPTEKKINGLLEEMGKLSEPINNLPHYFKTEFTYYGKYDLNDIKKYIQSAESVYPQVMEKGKSITLLYRELMSKYSKFYEFSSDPLAGEISSISYAAYDESHKTAMDNLYKKIQGYTPYISLGTVEPEKIIDTLSNTLFATKNAVDYLEKQKQKIISAYQKAASDFKSATNVDFSSLYDNPDLLQKKVDELNGYFSKAQKERDKIIKEISEVSFYGESEPTLKYSGFWDNEMGKKINEAEKVSSDFWASEKGQTIMYYINKEESRKIQDKRNPDLPVVRKLYEDLKNAYESRNASRVLSLIDPDWSSPDGDSVSDLSDHLNRTFKMFNEIKFNITELNIVPEENGIFAVSYNLDIISKIYSKNIKREEKSSVYEKVRVEDGRARIIRTENGSYWMIK